MKLMGEREERPGGTLRGGFEAGSRREVEGEGTLIRVEGLADRATALGLYSIRMQRLRERTCEARLSAPEGQAADVESA